MNTETSRPITDADRAELTRKLQERADVATMLLMVTRFLVVAANGHRFWTHAYPWQSLDAALDLVKAGAVSISMYPGCGHERWDWQKPGKVARRAVLRSHGISA